MVFVGGCFWCVEVVFECVEGVEEAIFGYVGGIIVDLIYKKVVFGMMDYVELVIVYYDFIVVSYDELFIVFFVGYDFM